MAKKWHLRPIASEDLRSANSRVSERRIGAFLIEP